MGKSGSFESSKEEEEEEKKKIDCCQLNYLSYDRA